MSCSSRARRSVSGSPRTSSSPSRSRSKAMKATGWALSILLDVACVDEVDPALQPLEAGRAARASSATISPSSSTGPRSFARSPLERTHDRGELRGLFVAEARPDANAVASCSRLHVHEGPDAVVLGFVDEARADERRFGQRRQHRADGLRFFAPFHRRRRCYNQLRRHQLSAISYQLSAISNQLSVPSESPHSLAGSWKRESWNR